MENTVSVIMPAFNEGRHIYRNVETTRSVLAEAGITAEIVVVDDGSDDNTLPELERAAQTFENVVVARNPYNMGKGMALRTGFDFSTGDIVVFLDADLDLHPSQITTIIEVLEGGPYDAVVTSKHHPQSRLDYPWSRKATSWIYYMIIKVMFGLPVRDTQTGLKVFRRKVLTEIFHRLLVKTFAYDVELLAVAVSFGYTVHEIPVALDFRRELTWGRIRIEDMFSIIVDTLAIFYRLRILRYYNAERPPLSRRMKSVLVVVRGCPPPDDVIKRLSIDSNVRIACIADETVESDGKIKYFRTIHQFDTWKQEQGETFEIIGFLGPGYLPNGSWVKNAVRNFEDPGILAVCGPLVPGPFSGCSGKAAGLAASTAVTLGPDYYLHSLRRIRFVRKGSANNVFIRADCWGPQGMDHCDISFENGFVYDSSTGGRILCYDPDVAVSKPVPPLFLPYLGTVAGDSFHKGCCLFGGGRGASKAWAAFPSLLWLVILVGWRMWPPELYTGFIVLYLTAAVLTGLSCFDFLTAPLFVAGIILEHLVRAVAFPLGLISRFFAGKSSD